MKPKLFIYRQPKLNALRQMSSPLLNISTRAVKSTFRGLVKHQSETNKFNYEQIKIIEQQQSIMLSLVSSIYQQRRTQRSISALNRLLATGKHDSYLQIAWGWVVDTLLFLIDLIWCVIQPILNFLVILIVRIFVTIACTVLIIYSIFKLIAA